MTEDRNSTDLREADIAFTDVLKALMEIMMTVGIAKPSVFDQLLASQRDAYLASRMATAAGIVEHLRRFATAPEREEHRQTLRKFMADPPQGSA